MMTTDKESCSMLAAILRAHGVRKAVLCPGARDLPLITAFARQPGIDTISIVDEREAAFIALGMAEISGTPVAVVCTSGSAILNMAPAASEAYYKHMPLLLISADRPEEWIDQDDSQTIRQNGVLDNIVKRSYTLPENLDSVDSKWYAERLINDTAVMCRRTPEGPVHINVPLSMPLNGLSNSTNNEIRIFEENKANYLSPEVIKDIAYSIQTTGKVLVAAGSNPPDSRLTKALNKISRLPNVYVLAENLSNLNLKEAVMSPDFLVNSLSDAKREELVPEILITFGGPVVSNSFKSWIRENYQKVKHWHVSPDENIADTYRCLERKYLMQPVDFFLQVAASLRLKWNSSESDYRACWSRLSIGLSALQKKYFDQSQEWCDLTALRKIIAVVPKETNIQVSNGLSVRYLMLLPESYRLHRVDCNRGVSGIDGCTSTALGASMVYGGPTVLISGDMSARYDIGALIDIPALSANFKMVVLANGGGNIFRVIKSAQGVAERDDYLVGMNEPEWQGLESSHGWWVAEVSSTRELSEVLPCWIEHREAPSMLIVRTDGETNAEYYRNLLKIKI